MQEIDRSRIIQIDESGGLEIDRSRIDAISQPESLSWQQDYPAKRQIMKYARPALEMGGMAAGSVVGSGASPIGSVAGAGLGMAAGRTVADRLEEYLGLVEKEYGFKERAERAGRATAEGAVYEAGGNVASKGISLAAEGIWTLANKMGLTGLFKKIKKAFPDLSDRGILLKAKEELQNVRRMTPEYERTAGKTERILNRRGVKTEPTFAQKTGSIKAGIFEQGVSAKNREVADILMNKDAKINQEVLDSIKAEFKGTESAGDVVTAVKGQHSLLKSQADKLSALAKEKTTPLYLAQNRQQVGQDIKATLQSAKTTEYNATKKIYDTIPENITVDAEPLTSGLKTLSNDFQLRGGGPNSIPSAITRQMRKKLKATKGKEVTFNNLRDWRSQIGQEKHDALVGQNPNLKLYRRLSMLEDSVEKTMNQLSSSGDDAIKAAYDEATRRYAQYKTTFSKGTVGDVLQVGNMAEGGQVALSDIPARFFKTGKLDAADDLIRAVGQQKAASLIDDYVGSDLLARAGNAGVLNPTRARGWLSRNKDVLNKYGLYNKYAEIVKSGEMSAQAIAKFKKYDDLVLHKILEADVPDVMKSLFGGQGKMKSATVANDLINLPGIKNNPAAIRGLQNGFKDFILSEMETTAVDTLGNPVRTVAKAKKVLAEYLPALRVIYKTAPEKVKALCDYHKMLQILARNKHISFSGNSTTVEKFTGTDALKTIGGNLAQYMAVTQGAGWKFSVLKNLWKATLGAPRKWSEQQVSALLTEAIYNPEVASTIMKATGKMEGKPAQLVQKEIRNHLIALGLYTTNSPQDIRK